MMSNKANVALMLAELSRGQAVTGTRQLRKAVKNGRVIRAFLAENADPAVTEPLAALCRRENIPVTWVPDKRELGRACGIEVGAAAAAAVR